MKCKDLIEYLSRFPSEELAACAVVDLDKRIHHKISAFQLLDDKIPALLLKTTASGPLDEIAEEEGG